MNGALEDGDLSAERIVDGSELHADSAGSDDNQGFRDVRQLENRAIGENLLVIGFDAGKRLGFRAADEKNVSGFNDGFLAVFFDGDFSGPFVTAPSPGPTRPCSS